MHSTNRTTSGFLTVAALKAGEVEQQAWTVGPTTHITTIKMIRPHPNPLFRLEHTLAYVNVVGEVETHLVIELFVDVNPARNLFRKLRNSPPSSTPEQTGSP